MINKDELNKVLYMYETCAEKSAFLDGKNWFKNNLWHDANEEPEKDKKLIVQYKDCDGDIDYEVDMYYCPYSWQQNVKNHNIIQWCYVEDLLK